MKISKSKQELARIISENGGWRDGSESAAQCTGGEISFWYDTATKARGENWCGSYLGRSHDIQPFGYKLPNWHQTILSRAEYFFLYQEQGLEDALNEDLPYADGWIEWGGGECPVEVGTIVDVKQRDGDFGTYLHAGKKTFELQSEGDATAEDWSHLDEGADIIAYRLHKPEQAKPEFCESVTRSIPEPEYKPSIEQLMQIHCDRAHALSEKKAELLVAERQESEALDTLKAACKEAGFDISPIEKPQESQEPELLITDWLDLQLGDIIEYVDGRIKDKIGMTGPVVEFASDARDGLFVRLKCDNGHNKGRLGWPSSWRFIRRP